MKGSTAVSVLVLMLLCASVLLVDAGSEGTPATPQDEYPDADVIICEGANGYVSLIYKMESADSTPSYYTRTVRNGFDARLFSSSRGAHPSTSSCSEAVWERSPSSCSTGTTRTPSPRM